MNVETGALSMRGSNKRLYFKAVLWVDGGLLIVPTARTMSAITSEYWAWVWVKGEAKKRKNRFFGATIVRGVGGLSE